MADYNTRRYKEGLGGKAPGLFWIDKQGHNAQVRGYHDHLRNKDLAERLSRSSSDDNDGWDYTPSPPTPLTVGWRIFWILILSGAAALLSKLIIETSEKDPDLPFRAYWVPGAFDLFIFHVIFRLISGFWRD